MKRLLLALLATLVALLLVEGGLSLAASRSLTELLGAPRAARARPAAPPSAPPIPKGAPGLYRVHPDPRVGYVLKADAELAIFDGQIHSDALGLRRRPLPSRGPDALRIAVLGDSVVFGYGLDDDQTLAHRLELLLDAVRAPGAPPVECATVAIPGWNHRNAVCFLLDHLDALDPDIVVYLPIPNDLYDTDGIDETGQRRAALDPASHDPWLSVNQLEGLSFFVNALETLRDAGREPLWSWTGPDVITSDMCPESQRRYAENVDSILRLDTTLTARGGKLLLLQWEDSRYAWNLRRRLAAEGATIPVLPLFRETPAELSLGFDPHPNAQTIEGVARWVAADLLRRGWVSGDASRVPEAEGPVAEWRAEERPLEAIVSDSLKTIGGTWSRLSPVIDFRDLQGVGQIFGGVHVDGTVGKRALFVLPSEGAALSVRLGPVAARPDLYPLRVAVQIDGQALGTIVVMAEGETEGVFDLLARPSPAPPIEVLLIPERCGVQLLASGWQSVSFRPLRLQCGTEKDWSLPSER